MDIPEVTVPDLILRVPVVVVLVDLVRMLLILLIMLVVVMVVMGKHLVLLDLL